MHYSPQIAQINTDEENAQIEDTEECKPQYNIKHTTSTIPIPVPIPNIKKHFSHICCILKNYVFLPADFKGKI